MLDIKWIRENKEEFDELLQKRGIKVNSEELLVLDEEKRQLTTLIQQFQQSRNAKSKKLGSLRGKIGRDFEDTKRDVEHINEKLGELSKKLNDSDRYKEIMDHIPNLPAAEVPYGTDETMNKFVRDFGEPKKMSQAKEHYDLGKDLGMMDFEQTAKISGSRFVTLKGKLAKLERALISFMIDVHVEEYGCQEISPPVLVRSEALYNVGQLPKFSDDSYLTEGGDYRLITTGEVPLTNLVANSIQKRDDS